MPEPIKPNQRYMPGLDGLRAIAVLGVIAYHLGFSGRRAACSASASSSRSAAI